MLNSGGLIMRSAMSKKDIAELLPYRATNFAQMRGNTIQKVTE
jgi:hypothetical protein